MLLNMVAPGSLGRLREQLVASAAEADRPVPKVAVWLSCAVDPGPEAAELSAAVELPAALYGAVDGQKLGVERPTVKARHSRKYFGRGKGVVAYTLLCNHVPLQSWLIGAHELEA